jgi:hypothetical protein
MYGSVEASEHSSSMLTSPQTNLSGILMTIPCSSTSPSSVSLPDDRVVCRMSARRSDIPLLGVWRSEHVAAVQSSLLFCLCYLMNVYKQTGGPR